MAVGKVAAIKHVEESGLSPYVVVAAVRAKGKAREDVPIPK
jgi:hypothetical protein